jgi:predicted Zn-dependent protease
MPERIEMLLQILKENPKDSFARYGLAMEYSKLGDVEMAMQEFSSLLAEHPDYSAGYFMAAQMLAKVGRSGEAKEFLTNGIAAASRTGNAHAKGEMEGMLDELDF